MLDGTYGRTHRVAPDRDGPTGRIKLGTESNGGFKNITISNCVFDRCRGLALETVDGGDIENVAISNITMRDVVNSPIFLRLGRRARGPNNPPPGALRRVKIQNLVASNVDARFPILLAGIPERAIEDVELSSILIEYRGGGTSEEAKSAPEERETSYPEPNMFGSIPAYGLFARHVRGLIVRDVDFRLMTPDQRPAVVLDDVVIRGHDPKFDGDSPNSGHVPE
jgi:polygalacturonase